MTTKSNFIFVTAVKKTKKEKEKPTCTMGPVGIGCHWRLAKPGATLVVGVFGASTGGKAKTHTDVHSDVMT